MLKTSFKVLFVILLTLVLLLSCSRKKDKFISRNFHALTAEYNILFNGYNAFNQGREDLNSNYIDNYWEVLPIERMHVTDQVKLAGQSDNEKFAYAEEKAVKAIQKHSMDVQGKERNPQMDEAYMLLGKARYFDQRFVPALEAFNYILYKYPASDKIIQAKIWREKTNIRLDNNELAIENLKRLLKQEQPEGQDLADATSMLAQAYLNTKSVDSALTQLNIAANATKSNDERGRYRFIQGQLYNKLGFKDSANVAFNKVIALNRKTPRIYMISAYVELIKNFDYESGDKMALFELLTDLEENRENRKYLDKIYHQKAMYFLHDKTDSLAIEYFNKSLATNSPDKILNARNYEMLGNINFDASMYSQAGKYYDSTMNSLVENSKPYRVIKRKRDNLEDVIYYENIAKVDDSILNVVNMSEPERTKYFNSYIETLKEKDQQEQLKAEAAERKSGLITVNKSMARQGGSSAQTAGSTFYFYTPTTVAYGKNEFSKIWGNRPLQDNWRWSSKGAPSISSGVVNDALTSANNEQRYSPEFYISKIPSEQKAIDSITKERNFAYYQLGIIYKEKFNELELSKNKFQNLLDSNPEERLVLPSKYSLYKIHEALGNPNEASALKNAIIANYPDSRYAAILNNPELVTGKDENSSESLYEALYANYENQDYQTVITKSDTYIKMFDGESIVPKFELLKANAIGRLQGYDAYSEAINYLAVTYANTPEGKNAQNIVDKVLPNLANAEFMSDTDALNTEYKVVFKFNTTNKSSLTSFKALLDEVLERVKYYRLRASVDVYSPETTLVVVHGLTNAQVANTFNQILAEEDQGKIVEPYFTITSSNYKIIQIHKNLDTYLTRKAN